MLSLIENVIFRIQLLFVMVNLQLRTDGLPLSWFLADRGNRLTLYAVSCKMEYIDGCPCVRADTKEPRVFRGVKGIIWHDE